MDLIINIIIGIAILGAGLWIFSILFYLFSGPSELSKSHKDNVIEDENFDSLEELFLDAVNLYSCPVTKDTIEFAEAAKSCAIIIAKEVNLEQKQQLISSLNWVSDMATKTGMSKKIINKHKEIIEYINQKDWSLVDAIKDKTELRQTNEELLEAILNYQGDYLKKTFPKHFD